MWSESNPFVNGPFEPLHAEYQIDNLEVVGHIPAELDGALYRTGSNQHFQPLNPETTHWFDGDGMVHAFFLRDGKAAYANKWVATEGLVAERSAGRALYNGIYATSRVAQPPLPAGAPPIKYVAGINVIPLAGKVLTTHEAAPHYWELDAQTLETIGTYNFGGRPDAKLTAHPHVDPLSGETLFYALHADNTLACFSVQGDGRVSSMHCAPLDGPAWIHDFTFSRDWYIFFLSPVLYHASDAARIARGDGALSFQPGMPSRILLVNRHDGSTRWIEERSLYQLTHFLNAYQVGDTIIVDACLSRISEADGSTVVSDYFPFPRSPMGPQVFSFAELNRWTLNPSAGTATHQPTGEILGEFLRGNAALAGQQHRYGYLASVHAVRDGRGFNCLLKHDYVTGRKQYQYLNPAYDMIPGEPVFVARGGHAASSAPAGDAGTLPAEDDGWVLSVWWDPRSNTSELVILDAAEFSGEPVARVHLKHRVPAGFHGNWISRESGSKQAA